MQCIKYILSLAVCAATFCAGAESRKLADIYIRDPFILPAGGTYYMYSTCDTVCPDGTARGGVAVFTSRDLKNWSGPKRVMAIPADNALTGRVWAPEVHEYKGKYYLFATINSDIKWKADREGGMICTHRATQVFRSDSPEGPFVPMDRFPTTPPGMMALDGTLWVEDGVPYMIYCHEWVQVDDGTMELVRLKPDLSGRDGLPELLFCGSAPEWSAGMDIDGKRYFVTDGCFLYRTKTGKLLMIWSTVSDGNYLVGVAESTTGSVHGPWRQQPDVLFSANGGHGMIFRSFDGNLHLVLHQPNHPDQAERARIFDLEDLGNTIKIKE